MKNKVFMKKVWLTSPSYITQIFEHSQGWKTMIYFKLSGLIFELEIDPFIQ